MKCNIEEKDTLADFTKLTSSEHLTFDTFDSLYYNSHSKEPKLYPRLAKCKAVRNKDTILLNIPLKGGITRSRLEILIIKDVYKSQIFETSCTYESFYFTNKTDNLIAKRDDDSLYLSINSAFQNSKNFKYFVKGSMKLKIENISNYPWIDKLNLKEQPKPINLVR